MKNAYTSNAEKPHFIADKKNITESLEYWMLYVAIQQIAKEIKQEDNNA